MKTNGAMAVTEAGHVSKGCPRLFCTQNLALARPSLSCQIILQDDRQALCPAICPTINHFGVGLFNPTSTKVL